MVDALEMRMEQVWELLFFFSIAHFGLPLDIFMSMTRGVAEYMRRLSTQGFYSNQFLLWSNQKWAILKKLVLAMHVIADIRNM